MTDKKPPKLPDVVELGLLPVVLSLWFAGLCASVGVAGLAFRFAWRMVIGP